MLPTKAMGRAIEGIPGKALFQLKVDGSEETIKDLLVGLHPYCRSNKELDCKVSQQLALKFSHGPQVNALLVGGDCRSLVLRLGEL